MALTMKERVLAVIPARGGSKGIPRKNIRRLGDRPLISYAIETCNQSNFVDQTVLTTDDREISQIGRQYDVDRVIERPQKLAEDDVPLAPVIEHAFEETAPDFDYVLCFQPTAPLVTLESLDEGIRKGIRNNSESLIYVRDETHHYWKEVENSFQPLSTDRKNRQQMDRIYEEIGLFLTSSNLVREGRRINSEPEFYEVENWEGIDIDTYSDWLLAESYLGRKLLVYRVTGNEETGMGHIYRGMTIADAIFEHDIVFAMDEEDVLAERMLRENNYDFEVLSDETFREFVEANRPDVVVNDILDTSAEYVNFLKDKGAKVVNFEDLGTGTREADVVINALYEYSDPPTNHHYGFKYFCLRDEFRYASRKYSIPEVETVMISFGGTDENNLTSKTISALSELDRDLHLDVVLGLGYDKEDELASHIDDCVADFSVEINKNISSMANHMEQADLLLTSNGRTIYEAASLNLPIISIAQNHREQKHPFAHVSGGVLALGLSEYVTEDAIRTAVNDYLENTETREEMRQALADHDIASGIERIKNIVFEEAQQ